MYGSASISHLHVDKLSILNIKLLRILQKRDLCTRTDELYKHIILYQLPICMLCR